MRTPEAEAELREQGRAWAERQRRLWKLRRARKRGLAVEEQEAADQLGRRLRKLRHLRPRGGAPFYFDSLHGAPPPCYL